MAQIQKPVVARTHVRWRASCLLGDCMARRCCNSGTHVHAGVLRHARLRRRSRPSGAAAFFSCGWRAAIFLIAWKAAVVFFKRRNCVGPWQPAGGSRVALIGTVTDADLAYIFFRAADWCRRRNRAT